MAVDIELTRHRFTVDEYHRMAQAGILNEDDRVELIRGEIVQMTAIGSRHASCVAAEASGPEYWIVDLEGDAVEVYRDPSAGRFRYAERVGIGGTLSPLAFPDFHTTVATILG